MNSKTALLLCCITMLLIHFCYYPKWTKERDEATLSWDVSGYYMYLPATFIYQDLKQCNFKDEILTKYNPTPNFQQAFKHEKTGNYVMKYPMGQAIIFTPFFATAHLWATLDKRFPADGFSRPYQIGISMGSILIAFIGLFFLRRILLKYFSDSTVAWTLILLVLGSNYLNYTAIDGAMTHNSLFTLYTILITLTISFYLKPSLIKGASIGLVVGLSALTRPTEIISCLLPIFWGINFLSYESIKKRLSFFHKQLPHLSLAVLTTFLVGLCQLLYWKYVADEFIVYSYQDQGFSWLHPHLLDGFFSYKSGWLLYSPLMGIALAGFIPLYRERRQVFSITFLFAMTFIYITFAWDIWWYGGSLGQRAMVQCYPILAIPFCAFVNMVLKLNAKWIKVLSFIVAIMCILSNFWFTHQAHKGKLLLPDQMTKAYFWKTLFTFDKNPENYKLLDNVMEIYDLQPQNLSQIFEDSTYSVTLNAQTQGSAVTSIPKSKISEDSDWIRASVTSKIKWKEWDWWAMTQFIVDFKNEGELVSNTMFRIQRQMNDHQSKRVYLDVRIPMREYTNIEVKFWNADSSKEILLSDLKVETFSE